MFLEGDGVTNEEEARCFAGGIVDGVGEARIEELGFTPDNIDMIEGADFTDDEIATMVDAYLDCVVVRQVLVANLIASIRPRRSETKVTMRFSLMAGMAA